MPFTNGVLITMGMSKRSAVPKHTEVSHTVCLYHVAVDTFPFTSMEYITPLSLLPRIKSTDPPVFNQGNINERNLAQIERDYDKFRRSGTQKTKAKLFNNVVRKPLLDVEIDHVAPPYLHILLGIVKKHHDLIQKECHYLDKHVAQSLAKTNEDFSSTQVFQDYVQQLREIEEQSQKHQRLETRLTMYQPEDTVPLATTRHEQQQLSDRIERLQCKIAEMKDKVTPLPDKSGPITANLESVLNNNKIYVQAYHSGSFVGNHCHKYLKPQVFTQICDSIVSKAKELTTDRGVIVRAQSVCDKFQALNSLFSDVHHRLSHQLPIPSTEADEIERCVKLYMSFFRQQFPQVRVTPKQHLLESHCVPWIRKWSFGMALHGEQGGEETHATVNILSVGTEEQGRATSGANHRVVREPGGPTVHPPRNLPRWFQNVP